MTWFHATVAGVAALLSARAAPTPPMHAPEPMAAQRQAQLVAVVDAVN